MTINSLAVLLSRFGTEYLLKQSTVIWLGVNLFLSILLKMPYQIFTIFQLYKYDKPIIIISASLNIVVSIILAGIIGIDGVLIGTFLTSMIYLLSRLYILGLQNHCRGDCSHEIKRRLLLGRKVMTNLDSIFKSRDITLPTKVRLVKAMVFPVVMYGCELDCEES